MAASPLLRPIAQPFVQGSTAHTQLRGRLLLGHLARPTKVQRLRGVRRTPLFRPPEQHSARTRRRFPWYWGFGSATRRGRWTSPRNFQEKDPSTIDSKLLRTKMKPFNKRVGVGAASTVPIAFDCGLTPRELEVLIILAQGNTLTRAQEELAISEDTAITHRRNIYRKLGVHSKQELVDFVRAR